MPNKYARDVSHIKKLDPYRLQELYGMHPCAEHVVKKLMIPGERSGGKSLDEDIADCIQTLERWQEMRAEDAEYAASQSNAVVILDATDADGRKSKFCYPWSSAPPWAAFAATGRDGRSFWYANKPVAVNGAWRYAGTTPVIIAASGHCIDWLQSLEARP